jgi:hypothetical protein
VDQARRFEKTGGDQVNQMPLPSDKELIKKRVGRTRGDVWDRLYHLNRFMAKFPRPQQADDGHTVRKVVGKARPR